LKSEIFSIRIKYDCKVSTLNSDLLSYLSDDSFIHFDLDGTLLNTNSANISAYQEAVNWFGGQWTNDATESLVSGRCSSEFLKKCIGIDSETFILIQERKNHLYSSKFSGIEPNTNTINFLKRVSPRAALVTSASRLSAHSLIQYFELDTYFSHVITASDVKINKPAPDCYIKSKELAETIFGRKFAHFAIEDSVVGMAAAASAGLTVLDVKLFL